MVKLTPGTGPGKSARKRHGLRKAGDGISACAPYHGGMRTRGFSLVELVVVIGLSTLASALVVPSLLHTRDRMAVQAGAEQLILAHREARLVSANSQRLALLRLAPDTLELRTVLGADTTLVWRRAGPLSFGIEVIGNPRVLRFIPFGYTIGGSNTTYTLRKGSAQRKVIISRLGRVRVE
jgi:Tfp pilus assembly protein FimT